MISQFFVYYITPCVFIHTFDVSMRIYNVNSREIKETTLNEKVCPNFGPEVYFFFSSSYGTNILPLGQMMVQ